MPEFSSILEAISFYSNSSNEREFCYDLSLDKSFSYADFNDNINRCANFINSLPSDKPKIISSAIGNSIEGLIIFFAAQKVGAAINPMPNSLSENEILRNLEFLNPDVIFLEKTQMSNNFKDHKIVYVDMEQRNFLDILCQYPRENTFFPNRDDIAALYYTSGTTSDPKCMEYSHNSQIKLIDSISHSFAFNEADIFLGVLPIGHTAITNYQLLPCLYNGSKLILAENYISLRQNLWELISEHNVSYLQVVPTILIMILNTPTQFQSFNRLNLKYIGCGSAPLSLEIQTQFEEKFGLPVSNLYGLSESGPSHFDNTQEKGWKPGSIGKPLDVNECVIFKDNFELADPNEVGEIALRGENIFNGYYKNSEATKKAMHGEYFLTGDLGYYDNEGLFYFSDRSKDLIIKAGVNIFPGEIEEIISTLDEIEMVAVVGIPNKILGEDISVFVKVKSGASITKEAIIETCNANLQPIKIPSLIEFVQEMPTTPSGKIIKRSLFNHG